MAQTLLAPGSSFLEHNQMGVSFLQAAAEPIHTYTHTISLRSKKVLHDCSSTTSRSARVGADSVLNQES